jgi:glyoxylase-like metal-dependent hydrolase (beta-lactamase superfamily II)
VKTTRRFLLSLVALATVFPNVHSAFEEVASDIFRWTSACNSYVVRSGEEAVVIDPGDGSLFPSLSELKVSRISKILLTSHHRELLQGLETPPQNVPIAAPRDEQAFLEAPTSFRKWTPRLSDKFAVHGSSYLRPPATPLKCAEWLVEGYSLSLNSQTLTAVSTPGHSPGALSYVLKRGNESIVFSGGVMHDGARMTNWFDSEWDYGFAKGIDALMASAKKLSALGASTALPSHGPVIKDAAAQFQTFESRLETFRPDYLRGYPVDNLSKRGPHPATKPTKAGPIVQVTPHLYMFGPEMAGKNFAILIADSGHALLLDCGLFSRVVLERLIADMKEHLGLKQIDACWISHSHGDHFTLFPALQEHGVKFWTMDSIADKCENPRAYDYPAMIGAYNAGFESAKIDRILKAGEIIEWEGYKLHVDWMPGQTEFGNALWLELDGKKVVFTGDNIFADPNDSSQNGHECVNAKNSAIISEGYLVAAKYLERVNPDLIVGAHGVLMTNPSALVQRYKAWAERMISRFRELLPDTDYEYQFDPYWVSAYPYRVDLRQQDSTTVTVTVRNFRTTQQSHQITLQTPPGIRAEPQTLSGTIAGQGRQSFPVKLTVTNRDALPSGVQIAPMDIHLDAHRYGQLFDFILLGKDE